MRFQNVSFEGCSVLVLAGAKATLDSCPAMDTNVFLVASGAHTQVRCTPLLYSVACMRLRS